RVAEILRTQLDDACMVWYDIPVGKKRRYPDFVILHPRRGLLFLEVKDWKTTTFKNISSTSAQILTSKGMSTEANPLEQARAYSMEVINMLQADKALQQIEGLHKGRLKIPYGHGVVLSHIPRKNMFAALAADAREKVLPDHLVLYQEDLHDGVDAETIQEQLWGMFPYQFGEALSAAEVDRVRWHLFPEIRIDAMALQGQLFAEEPLAEAVETVFKRSVNSETVNTVAQSEHIPDVIKVMDMQQEQLARNLGSGHRVIHGVAGSGKTLILAYRCQYLALQATKPILVLCFNVTLAAKLRAMMVSKGLGDKVQALHFHDWCAEQLRQHEVAVMEGEGKIFDRQVDSVLQAVADGRIPTEQYGAILIDEGHDFAAEWLQVVTQMLDREEESLLLLYDDAQSIYRRGGLNFTLSSVGIKAQGRTSILRLNYRNSREILAFAAAFANAYWQNQDVQDEDQIPVIAPEAAGISGPEPVVYQCVDFASEAEKAVKCIQAWQKKGLALNKVAILAYTKDQAKQVSEALVAQGIDTQLLLASRSKKAYQPHNNSVAIMTLHSSKGLEFSHVVVMGVGQMGKTADRISADARVLYVGLTRAQRALVVTGSGKGAFIQQLVQQVATVS
ncbi:MAG: AAA family ATPase, partial [Vitreoscilla sp.]|nr:AAA family ATPase [Vitreoscilla sp.]